MARNYTDDPTASTTLAAAFDSDTSSTLTVASSSGFPAVPFYVAIKRGLAEQQVVEVTGVAGTTWTVTPVSGVSPTHASGSPIEHVAPAFHFNTVEAHVDATTAHGSGSAIVGKDQSVTLTNKTMSGSSNTFSAIPQSAVTNLGTDLGSINTRLNTVETGITEHVFTASGSLAASAVTGAKKLKIRMVGGGGAGGAAVATGANQNSVGAGGQAGTYAEVVVTVSSLVFPLAVTVGAAGAGGAGAGGAGGLSRVRDNNGTGTILCEANGGGGGAASTVGGAGTNAAGGQVAASGVGSVISPGAHGLWGAVFVLDLPIPGYGGNSVFGAGGSLLGAATNLAGQAAAGYGGGGSGSSRRQSQAALNGGNGAAGLVLIEAIY